MDENSEYGIHSRHYLQRAIGRMRENGNENLIYATLELRCAIEARLQEIIDPHSHIPAKSKKQYKIGPLAKTVETKLCGSKGSEITLRDAERSFTLLYIPVSSKLREFAQKSGIYLHAAQRRYSEGDWTELRRKLECVILNLERTLEGNLLGPALLQGKREAKICAEMVEDQEALTAFIQKCADQKSQIQVSVTYFEID